MCVDQLDQTLIQLLKTKVDRLNNSLYLQKALFIYIYDVYRVLNVLLEDHGGQTRQEPKIIAAHLDQRGIIVLPELKILEDASDRVVQSSRVPLLIENLIEYETRK